MDKALWLTESDTIADMVNHPAFAGFGAHLIPRPQDAQSDLPLSEVGRLMPWHSHVRPDMVTTALNRMIDDATTGKTVFYPFHAEREKRERTGLFYFRGRPGTPFALIFPGGGFAYVGSLHEGFPLAEVLSREGYNAFVLHYRTGGPTVAYEDMAAALSWIFRHAEELEVSTQGYSVWGGSAGARMAADLGSYGAAAFGGDSVPRPATVVMAYTGHDRYTESDPPTFAVVSEDDPIASPRMMERRIAALNAAGVDTEFHLYRNAGHGFGVGTGTDAEGWMELAVRFWEKHMTTEVP
ncbi:alpha/beta hydrolase [uncultured Mailhella sp.]|uniref:alpha/beta hydrolase n=1 Tax=uncultured Mailhella sp. TaxID=1981031 RepID=UPI0026251C8A|nr:alpha/beta hydrolase [uncultured Mailhella sp.]